LKIAYLINDYPKVSHSFIRREILALEDQGFAVQRIAIRGWAGMLPNEEDRRERELTRYVLREGPLALLAPTLRAALRAPTRFFGALRLALHMARESDRALAYHLAYLAEACRILPWLNAFGARRIHAHFGTNSTDVAMLVSALGGPPYSFTVHGPEEFLRPVGLSEKIRRSAFVVAISSFGRSQLYLWTPYVDWPKIKVVHCGIEKSFYESAPGLPAAAPRLVCVGRLAAEKGQLLLIEAAARLASKGVQFELVLAGDGPTRGQLDELIQKYGLEDRVRITGWISSNEVRQEILAARVLVQPSLSEGLPVVIMEAMALRRPVLATFIAGIPELVRHGETGWLIPAASVDELTSALEDCLSRSPEELQSMGELAHRRVIARHSIDAQAATLAELFVTSSCDPWLASGSSEQSRVNQDTPTFVQCYRGKGRSDGR
jgi:colanic acid/amylovoran biosynthesis glycosyltransferase